jgi:hypothetical protein
MIAGALPLALSGVPAPQVLPLAAPTSAPARPTGVPEGLPGLLVGIAVTAMAVAAAGQVEVLRRRRGGSPA